MDEVLGEVLGLAYAEAIAEAIPAEVWQHYPMVCTTSITHPESLRNPRRLGGLSAYVRVKWSCGNGLGTCFPTSRD